MVPFGRLLDALSEVPDPRRAEGKRYPLAPLLLFTVLTLLSDVAGTQPLVCLVDDAHWLDHASALVLAFVARRLGAESILLVFALERV